MATFFGKRDQIPGARGFLPALAGVGMLSGSAAGAGGAAAGGGMGGMMGGFGGMMGGGGGAAGQGAMQMLTGLTDSFTKVAGLWGAGGPFGEKDPNKLKLPPEYELQMLDYFQQTLDQYAMISQQNQQMIDIYNQRMDAASGLMSKTIPSEQALQTLTDTSSQLAQLFGGDAKALAESGFMDDYTKDYLAQAQKEYANIGTTNNANPVLEQQIQEQQRQLDQQLARDGVPPAQRAIALQQLAQNANMSRFQANNEISTQRINALGNIQGNTLQARQTNYGLATQGYQNVLGQLNFAQQGINQLSSLYGSQYAANLGNQAMQMQLANAPQQLFNNLGQYRLTGATRSAIGAGVVGPGSYYQQTGYTRGSGNSGIETAFKNNQQMERGMYGSQNALSRMPSNMPGVGGQFLSFASNIGSRRPFRFQRG